MCFESGWGKFVRVGWFVCLGCGKIGVKVLMVMWL